LSTMQSFAIAPVRFSRRAMYLISSAVNLIVGKG
jgi:hypothetical protein